MDSLPSEIRNLRQYSVFKNNRPLNYLVGESGVSLGNIVDVNSLDTLKFCESMVKRKNADGIAFYLLPKNGYTVIELNNSINDKEIAKKYNQIISRFSSYTETSCDGTGFTIICKGYSLPITGTISVNSCNYFVKLSGNRINSLGIADAQAKIDELVSEIKKIDEPEIESDHEVIEKIKAEYDDDTFQRLWFADWHSKYSSAQEASISLIELISKITRNKEQIQRIFSSSELAREVESSKISPLTDTVINKPAQENKEVVVDDLTYPPGRLGEIAKYIYASSAHPVKEISILASIMNTAGICARNFCTRTNASLNHYLMLVAGTGVGKDEANKSRARIYREVGKRLGIDMQFAIGPASLGSGEGLVRYLSNNSKCFSSIFTEFWQVMSRCSKKNPTSADESLKKALIVYYDFGSQIVGSTAYSDEKKTIAPIHRPNITIFGESNPKDFYASLNEGMISSGLLPRFILVEYKGLRQYENEEAYNHKMPEDLIDFMAQLTRFCLDCNNSDVVIKVQAEADAIKQLTAIDRETTDKINAMAKENETLKELYNRVRLKVLKLSALMAVLDCPQDRNGCYDFSSPIVNLTQVNWAYDFIMRSSNELIRKFEAGEIGNNDNDERLQHIELIKTIKSYNAKSYNELTGYGVHKKAHDNGYISYRYICQKNTAISCFRNHRLGATLAIKNCLKRLIDIEEIEAIPSSELAKVSLKGQYFKLKGFKGSL